MAKKFSDFKKQLERIYNNNKVYQQKMNKVGITLNDIKSWNDISKLH